MSDSAAIDQALIDRLLNDATLRALLPDGVFWEEAGASMLTGGHPTQFVIVSLIEAVDEARFGGRAYEDVLYLVKAVELSTAAAHNSKAAAARIDVLLEDAVLTAAGYTWMTGHREARIRFLEVDDTDAAIRWHHRGGHYRVQASLGA
jgi:hypothetical protein